MVRSRAEAVTREIRLEAWSEQEARLDAESAAAMRATGLVDVRLGDSAASTWRLITDSRVGVAVGDTWTLRVAPKLRIPRLMFLLGYALDPKGWRDQAAPVGDEDDLFEAIANGFAFHALRAIEPDPLRGYVAVDERAAMLRGRLRAADQIARGKGLPLPLEITFDDYALDIPENRLLRSATEVLLRFRRIPEAARRRLRRVRAVLADVEPSFDPWSAGLPAPTRLNERYRSAMALAWLILRSTSISSEAGSKQSITFSFDMNRVFEDFVFTALRDALASEGGTLRRHYDGRYLDAERTLKLIPDVTWWKGSQCVAVLDAKYKRVIDHRFPNADAYQMLAYGSVKQQDRRDWPGYVEPWWRDLCARDRRSVPRCGWRAQRASAAGVGRC